MISKYNILPEQFARLPFIYLFLVRFGYSWNHDSKHLQPFTKLPDDSHRGRTNLPPGECGMVGEKCQLPPHPPPSPSVHMAGCSRTSNVHWVRSWLWFACACVIVAFYHIWFWTFNSHTRLMHSQTIQYTWRESGLVLEVHHNRHLPSLNSLINVQLWNVSSHPPFLPSLHQNASHSCMCKKQNKVHV